MKIFRKTVQYLIAVPVLILCSCSPFSKIANRTSVVQDGSYLAVVNPQAGIKALTFGDFQFATHKKEYRALHKSKSPYKDILVYAQTSQPTYEYYILYNPKNLDIDSNNFLVKDTLIDQSRYVMLISTNAPQKDIVFLQNNISIK